MRMAGWPAHLVHVALLDRDQYRRTLIVRVRLKPDGTRWRNGGEVKGILANGVGSQYFHTTSERGVSSITTAEAHTSAASSRLNRRPSRFKLTSPFRRKTKSGFCACAIMFQTQSTTQLLPHAISYVAERCHHICLTGSTEIIASPHRS